MKKIDKELLEEYIQVHEKELEEAIKAMSDSDGEATVLDISQETVIKAVVLLLSKIFYDEFHYPQPQKGRYDVAENTFEKLKWVYRHWFNQLEVAEKNSGIEEYIKNQVLEFPLPDDFKESSRATLAGGGDLLAVDVLNDKNITHLFDDVKDFYFSADLVCANLETTIYSEAPFGRNQVSGEAARMNTSEEVFQRFYDDGKGINFFSLANNHSNDYGTEGILATLGVLDNYGVYHTGTNSTAKEQDEILIIEKNGVKIAMLSFTMDLNGHELSPGEEYLVNEVRLNDEVCDFTLVEKQVASAREKGADIVIACCHWGWEFEMYPHRNVMEAGHRILEMGVDVILGNHPHVAQPMERYTYEKDGETKNGLIVYSCGDFVAYHPKSRNSKLSYIVKFDLVKGIEHNKDAAYITNLKMLPVYMLNEQIDGDVYNCRMLRFSNVLNDTAENGAYQYGLSDLERSQLAHLNDVVLHKIILPESHDGLLAD